MVPTVEHSAVRAAAARAGAVTVVGVDPLGRVDPDEVLAAIRADTCLVHVQWGNHEVGTSQPVAEVVTACRERGVLVHVDAAQAVGRCDIAFDELGADLMSISGHKLGGPPGTGALLVRRGLRLAPLLLGGDQERARRAGMENVPAVVGLGAAASALHDDHRLATEAAGQRRLTERVLDAVPTLDGVSVYGDPTDRLPHLVCLGVAGIEPQAVLLGLDQAGIAAHSGSACASESLEPSPVLEAMGVDAHRSLRISVGWNTTDADVDALLDALPKVIAHMRALGAGCKHRRPAFQGTPHHPPAAHLAESPAPPAAHPTGRPLQGTAHPTRRPAGATVRGRGGRGQGDGEAGDAAPADPGSMAAGRRARSPGAGPVDGVAGVQPASEVSRGRGRRLVRIGLAGDSTTQLHSCPKISPARMPTGVAGRTACPRRPRERRWRARTAPGGRRPNSGTATTDRSSAATASWPRGWRTSPDHGARGGRGDGRQRPEGGHSARE